MSDPRFDHDFDRAGLGHDYDRVRARHTGAGGAWAAGFILAAVLLIGGLIYLGGDDRTQVATNTAPGVERTVPASPAPAAPANTSPTTAPPQ